MENRRPPRSNSSGRKSYFDRGRGAQHHRDGKPAGHGPGKSPRRGPRNDSRQRDSGPRTGDGATRRAAVGYGRSDGNRPGYDRYRPQTDGRYRLPAARRTTTEPEIKITSDSQITDGKLRGKTLQNSDSPNTVPTVRKLREIAFKILSRRIKAARVLDLGAGSGTIGIEAISRGAMLATFVERSARMCSFIRKNLDEMGVKNGHGEIVEMEILPFLKRTSRRKRVWDIVYFDLPGGDDHKAILDQLSRGTTVRSAGLLLVEHASDSPYPEAIGNLRRWRTIEQGEKIVTVYERI